MSANGKPGFDPAKFKAIERAGYNLIAQRYSVAAESRAALNAALLDAAAIGPGQSVLDIASGPGTLTLAAAERIGAGGRVVASDLAEATLAQCLAVGRSGGMPIHCVAADAERLPFSERSFDRVLCGLGLMFFLDELGALRETLRILRPGGLAALSVWGQEADVPLVACALACMRRNLPPPKLVRPSVFRLGDPRLLERLLAEAGFEEVRVTPFALASAFPDAAAYWQSFLDLAGGAAWSLSRLPEARRQALVAAVGEELAAWRNQSGYALTSKVWIATARRPAEREPA
jgi:ubiquinone/menaquinone biosynthesis C-methylase UbiE